MTKMSFLTDATLNDFLTGIIEVAVSTGIQQKTTPLPFLADVMKNNNCETFVICIRKLHNFILRILTSITPTYMSFLTCITDRYKLIIKI